MASQAEVDLIINATRTLPELERDLDRVLSRAQADMSDLDVDAVLDQTATLRQLDRDLDRVIAAARAGADDIDLDAALNQQSAIRQTTRDLDNLVRAVSVPGVVPPALITAALNAPVSVNRVRNELNSVVRAVQATAPTIDVDVDVDRDGIQRLGTALLSATGALGRFGAGIGAMGAAAGTAAPLLAGLAGAVESVVPAAAVATTGILAMQLAAGALKLGLVGVEEALSEAFEPDPDMEKVNEALARLSPSARAAVNEIIKLKPAFRDLQLDVQQILFKGFSAEIRALSKTVLPDARRALLDTAGTLNAMGKGVSDAAQQLSESGVLGQALKSATNGLADLRDIPGQAVLAFGLLAQAAGPSFERITTAAAGAADSVTKSLTDAFKSGALEDAINDAVDAIAQLGRVAGNIFGGLSNIIDAVSVNGQGLFGVLEQLSQGFEDITGTQEVQEGLRALAETMGVLYKTAGPLLAEAIKIVGRVLVELSGPAQELIRVLGDALGGILEALGPVLVELADAFGKLVIALSPIITLAGELIAGILPVLTPLFKALGDVFVAMTPFIDQLSQTLSSVLTPILAALPGIVEAVITPFVKLAEDVFPILTDALVEMAPDFADLGREFGELLVALAPLIESFGELVVQIAEFLLPILPVLMEGVELTANILTGLATVFTEVVIPAVQIFIDLLQGDFFTANEAAAENVRNLRDRVSGFFSDLVGRVRDQLSKYAGILRDKASEAADRFMEGVRGMVDDATDYVRDLPDRIRGALGDLGDLLYSAGQDIIGGLVSGIQSKIGDAISAAQSAASAVKDSVTGFLGIQSPSRVMAEIGVDTIDGFALGMRKALPSLRADVLGIAGLLPRAMSGPSPVSAPAAGSMVSPIVHVTIGNEAVDQYVTSRVIQVDNQRTRTMAQGVRI